MRGLLFKGRQWSNLICPRLAVVIALFVDDKHGCGEPRAVFTRAAGAASAAKSRTCGRLYLCDAIL
jgi:hypothetical protein